MTIGLDFLLRAALIGAGATAFMDFANLVLERVFKMAAPNYALVGRWIGHFPRGRFSHAAIGKAEAVPGEAAIGWTAHYVIGAGYAALLLLVAGPEWARQPTLAPALLVGLATIVAPFLVMQPAMGAGFVAAKMPNPNAVRARSLLNHAIFGLGLYLSGRLLAAAW